MVSGLSTADERRDDARRLLEWGFRGFAEAKLYDAGEVVGHARVWGGQRMYVPLAGKSDVNVWLPRNMANQKLRASIVYQWPLKPPLRKGDQVAVLRVTTSSESMNEVPLFVAEDVDPAGTMRRGFRIRSCAWPPGGCLSPPAGEGGHSAAMCHPGISCGVQPSARALHRWSPPRRQRCRPHAVHDDPQFDRGARGMVDTGDKPRYDNGSEYWKRA